jgi:hypothetical protein
MNFLNIFTVGKNDTETCSATHNFDEYNKYNEIINKLNDNILHSEIYRKENDMNINKLNVYKLDASSFIDLDIDVYRDNRMKNLDHINKLKEGIEKTGCLFHNFIVVNNLYNKTIQIYDGQHRYDALRLLLRCRQKEITCFLYIYEINPKENQDVSFNLFKMVNSSIGINKEELNKHEKIKEVMEYIKNMFGKYYGKDRIYDENIKGSPEWRLSYNKLKIEIEKRWDKLCLLNSSDIYMKLKIYNDNCIKEKVYNRISNNESKIKCEKSKFCLNINFPYYLDTIF